jgi:hypothetical protein
VNDVTSQRKSRVLLYGLFAAVAAEIAAPMVLSPNAAQMMLGAIAAVSIIGVCVGWILTWVGGRKAAKTVREVHRSTGIQVIAATLNDAEEGDAR